MNLLSTNQKAMWVMHQIHPQFSAYNFGFTIHIHDLADPEIMREAFIQLVNRHPVLRSVIRPVNGEPMQFVQPAGVDFKVVDAGSWLPHKLAEAVQQALHHPFDLEKDFPIRVILYSGVSSQVKMQVVFNHIAMDGWSMWVLLDELAELLSAATTGRESLLPPLRAQYQDFVRWQRQYLEEEEGAKSATFWREVLLPEPPVLALPADFARKSIQNFAAATHPLVIHKETTTRLRQLAREEGVSLYELLLATFQIFLHRYSGQNDIAVGTPAFGRRRPFGRVIGLFTNTIIMRDHIRPDSTFRQFVQQNSRRVQAALAHQHFPFARLVAISQPVRDLSRMPLVQYLLNFIRPPRRFQDLFSLTFDPNKDNTVIFGGLTVSDLVIQGQGEQFDLNLEILDLGEALYALLGYDNDHFSASTITWMAHHFLGLLKQVGNEPDQFIGHFSMLTPAEEKLVKEWNNTNRSSLPANFPCLHDWVGHQSATHTRQIAVSDQAQALTYGELEERANQLAHYLQKEAIGVEDVVAVLPDESVNRVVAQLGILKAGAAFLPLDPDSPPDRLRFLLADAGARLLVFTGNNATTIAGSLPVVHLDDPAITSQPTHRPKHNATGRNLAYVIFTSGSTGAPKGIQVEHRQVINLLAAVQQQPGLETGDRLLAISKPAFDISILETFWPLVSGARVVISSREETLDGRLLLSALQKQKISVLAATPTTWSMLISAGWQDIPHLRLAICGGETVPWDLAQQIMARGVDLYHGYGPTEATVLASLTPVAENAARITIGPPLANTQMHVLDHEGRSVPIGIVGELCLGGNGVARGYVNRPKQQAIQFQPDPYSGETGATLYRTGDLVRRLPDGRLIFHGRADYQVKIRGLRVELAEIESVLQQHPAVAQAAVIFDDDQQNRRQLVAYIVPANRNDNQDERWILSFLQSRLPVYMIPAAIIFLDEFPLTANYKIDRRALPRPEIEKNLSQAPVFQSETEKLIAEIWAEILPQSPQNSFDNFFYLGGHSLLATQVVSRIEIKAHVSLPLRAIFDNQTVAGLAREVDRIRAQEGSVQHPAVQVVPREEPFALSYAQERMWFLHQLAPTMAAYHIPIAVHFHNKLDTNALEKALTVLAGRHESLRTIFPANEGTPQQFVLPTYSVDLQIIDLSSVSAAGREKAARQLIQADTGQAFDLTQTPPWRSALFLLGEQETILYFVFHHIIFDQWSTIIFWRELLYLYEQYRRDIAPQLPSLAIQYGDYALWQRRWLQEGALTRLLAFWKPQLAGIVPLDLPTDLPRPAVQTFQGAVEYLNLPSSFVDDLRVASERAQVSLFMFLLTAFKVLLMHYTGQTDIAVGVPVANRHRLEVEPIIGTFVNTLVVRTQLDKTVPFEQLLNRIRDELLAAYAHQDMPFEQLVREADSDHDLSRNPLVQVFFNMANTPVEEALFPQMPFTLLRLERSAAQVDLTMTAALEKSLPAQPHFLIEYNSNLFDRLTIQRFLRHYQALLKGILDFPKKSIHAYELSTPVEKLKMLVEWNATAKQFAEDTCLHDLVSQQVGRSPRSVAVTYHDQSLTYLELDERSNQVAHFLRELGVGPEHVVGLMMEPGLTLVVGLLGILKAGGAYLPLDPHFPANRLTFMLEDAGTTVVLTESRVANHLPAGGGINYYELDTHWPLVDRQPVTALPAIARPHNLAYLIYTSGSTGRPKGVQIEHRQVNNFLRTMQERPGIFPEDVLLSVTTLSFDIAVLELFLPLTRGAHLVLVDRPAAQDGRELIRNLEHHQATIMQATPATWSMLIEAGWAGSSSLRLALCGGEALPAGLATDLLKRKVELWNMYGPTETTIWSSIHQVEMETRSIPIGRPVGNTTFYILDANGNPVPAGVRGELVIGGAGVARGYHNRPRLIAEKFVPDPFANGLPGRRLYRTGDLARFLADGTVEYRGRLDAQIKFHGQRIEPGEISAAILTHPFAAEAVVILHKDGADHQLVAYIIPAGDVEKPSITAWRHYLGERLPGYMIPATIIYLDKIPLTPNRKVDYKALPSPDTVRPKIDSQFVPPRNDVEQVMVDIMADLLGLEQVGVYDHFFELGGHSLQATRYVAQVGRAFRMEIPLWDFFRAPQIAPFAEHLLQLPETGEKIAQIAQLRLKMASLSEEEVRNLLVEKSNSAG